MPRITIPQAHIVAMNSSVAPVLPPAGTGCYANVGCRRAAARREPAGNRPGALENPPAMPKKRIGHTPSTHDFRRQPLVSSLTAPVASAPATSARQRPPVDLAADLAKCERQLADWTSCPSRKTPEGKAKIKEIGDRITVVKVKMQQAEQGGGAADAQPPVPAVARGATATAPPATAEAAGFATYRFTPASRAVDAPAALGTRIDLFA
jgi:hypothetical protein